jgi:ATP-dependent Clp protease adaptor protein ClpS
MKLFILNDEINSFDHVVGCIQRYLNYPHMQACSIAEIVHRNGKCLVKQSNDDELVSTVYELMMKDGLTLKLETNND